MLPWLIFLFGLLVGILLSVCVVYFVTRYGAE